MAIKDDIKKLAKAVNNCTKAIKSMKALNKEQDKGITTNAELVTKATEDIVTLRSENTQQWTKIQYDSKRIDTMQEQIDKNEYSACLAYVDKSKFVNGDSFALNSNTCFVRIKLNGDAPSLIDGREAERGTIFTVVGAIDTTKTIDPTQLNSALLENYRGYLFKSFLWNGSKWVEATAPSVGKVIPVTVWDERGTLRFNDYPNNVVPINAGNTTSLYIVAQVTSGNVKVGDLYRWDATSNKFVKVVAESTASGVGSKIQDLENRIADLESKSGGNEGMTIIPVAMYYNNGSSIELRLINSAKSHSADYVLSAYDYENDFADCIFYVQAIDNDNYADYVNSLFAYDLYNGELGLVGNAFITARMQEIIDKV